MMQTIPVSKIGKANVVVNLVPKGNTRIRPARGMNPNSITVHNTANAGDGANAEAHNRLLHNESAKGATCREASYHFAVDATSIYQNLPLDENSWHGGDGLGDGNMKSISMEICENVDMDYHQAEENAIALIVYLMKNLGIKDVFPHQHWSGKHCPHKILDATGGWAGFNKRIILAKADSNTKPVPVVNVSKPASTPQATGKPSYLKEGDKGSYVKELQTKLNKAGYKLTVDGSFGPATENAVRSFQKNHSLVVDGFAGKATQGKLNEVIKPKPAKPAPAKVASGIKVLGKIKVANLRNFTYIYSKPNDDSTILGKAPLGHIYDIAGSVPEFYEVIYQGKRAYVKAKYANRI